jgi:signal transduction histidine kinase
MVTSFLNFARPQPLDLDEVNLNDMIADCANELTPLFNQRRIELLNTGTTGVPPAPSSAVDDSKRSELVIRADERMLRQALLNLIRNAAEAIADSETERRVEVASSLERDSAGKEWAVVEVKDTGEGIPPADLQRIFIPFFTTKATGHGVGLALAHRVVTQHGGTLTAANARNGGAVFSLRLPILECADLPAL